MTMYSRGINDLLPSPGTRMSPSPVAPSPKELAPTQIHILIYLVECPGDKKRSGKKEMVYVHQIHTLGIMVCITTAG